MSEQQPVVECEIVKTPCYPNAFKIEYLNYKSDNATWRYKASRAEAMKFCTKRGWIIRKVCSA